MKKMKKKIKKEFYLEPYLCKYCNERFRFKQNLRNHKCWKKDLRKSKEKNDK